MKGMVTDQGHVVLSMSEAEARNLHILASSECRRRQAHFESSQIMECWGCFNVCSDLTGELDELGFTETEAHSDLSGGSHG